MEFEILAKAEPDNHEKYKLLIEMLNKKSKQCKTSSRRNASL